VKQKTGTNQCAHEQPAMHAMFCQIAGAQGGLPLFCSVQRSSVVGRLEPPSSPQASPSAAGPLLPWTHFNAVGMALGVLSLSPAIFLHHAPSVCLASAPPSLYNYCCAARAPSTCSTTPARL
jgi:hypothetical protein